jgi:hypothetical protein
MASGSLVSKKWIARFKGRLWPASGPSSRDVLPNPPADSAPSLVPTTTKSAEKSPRVAASREQSVRDGETASHVLRSSSDETIPGPQDSETKPSSSAGQITCPPEPNPKARSLLDALLDANGYQDADWQTRPTNPSEALCWAVSTQNSELVEILIDRGASVQYHPRSTWLITPAIHRAILRRDERAAFRLLDAFPEVISLEDADKKTPLSLAVEKGALSTARELLNRQAAIEQQDYFGRAPLHHAARRGHYGMAKFLLEKGANRYSKDYKGQTAEALALSSGYTAIAQMLRGGTETPLPRVAEAAYRGWSKQLERRKYVEDDDLQYDGIRELFDSEPEDQTPPVRDQPLRGAEPAQSRIIVVSGEETYMPEEDWDDGFTVVEYQLVKEDKVLSMTSEVTPDPDVVGVPDSG